MTPTIPTALAALLLTGCNGTLWGLPAPPLPRFTPAQPAGPAQLATPAAMAQPVAPTTSPADVPGPAALPVVLVTWWWARRLRRRVNEH